MVGKYVHYKVRFENTGTANAQNIVVNDMIDADKFDVDSLIPLDGSHAFVTRIKGNKVEFLFEGINLPFDDINNDGYLVFKIKAKPTLVLGDTFSSTASIYFDYNFPVVDRSCRDDRCGFGEIRFCIRGLFEDLPESGERGFACGCEEKHQHPLDECLQYFGPIGFGYP
jgi:hypothetical protein